MQLILTHMPSSITNSPHVTTQRKIQIDIDLPHNPLMLHYKLLGIIKSLFVYFKDSKISNLE